MTLEPDGKATGCNPVEVGSTPIGVSRPVRLFVEHPQPPFRITGFQLAKLVRGISSAAAFQTPSIHEPDYQQLSERDEFAIRIRFGT